MKKLILAMALILACHNAEAFPYTDENSNGPEFCEDILSHSLWIIAYENACDIPSTQSKKLISLFKAKSCQTFITEEYMPVLEHRLLTEIVATNKAYYSYGGTPYCDEFHEKYKEIPALFNINNP